MSTSSRSAFVAVAVVASCVALVAWFASRPGREPTAVEPSGASAEIEPDRPAGKDPSLIAALQRARAAEEAHRFAPLAPEDGLRIEGVVLELAEAGRRDSARPMAHGGVRLRAVPRELAEHGGGEWTRLETDAGGKFALTVALDSDSPRAVEFRVDEDGTFRALNRAEALGDESGERLEVELVRVPHGDIHGFLVDPGLEPIAGVELGFGPDVEFGDLWTSPSRLARTDEAGRFRLSPFRGVHRLIRCEDPTYCILFSEPPRPRALGGWHPWRVVGAASAEVEIVVTSAGEPLEGLDVLVDASDAEFSERNYRPVQLRSGRVFRGPSWSTLVRTDVAGVVSLAQAPANSRLRISIETPERVYYAETARGGRLVLRAGPGPEERELASAAGEGATLEEEPILAPAGGRLRLVAELPPVRRLVGRVRYPNGTPSSGSAVRLFDRSSPAFDTRRLDVSTRTEPDGSFQLDLLAPSPDSEFSLVAIDGSGPISDVTFGEPPAYSTGRLLRLTDGDPPFVELVLEPTLALAGRLRFADGSRPNTILRAIPGDAEYYLERPPSGLMSFGRGDAQGNFSLGGLVAGSYRIAVSERRSDYRSDHVFGPFEAGRTDLDLFVEDDRRVEFVVRVRAPERLRELTVLLARTHSRSTFGSAPAPARRVRCETLDGWPLRANFLRLDDQSFEDGDGLQVFRRHSFQVPAEREFGTTLPRQQAGEYRLGVSAIDVGGRPLFPMATPLWSYGEGRFEIEFELVRTTPLRGRVDLEGVVGRRALAFRRAGEGLLPLGGTAGSLTRLIEPGNRGEFGPLLLPEGPLRVLVGTPSELLGGGGGRTIDLELPHADELVLPAN